MPECHNCLNLAETSTYSVRIASPVLTFSPNLKDQLRFSRFKAKSVNEVVRYICPFIYVQNVGPYA